MESEDMVQILWKLEDKALEYNELARSLRKEPKSEVTELIATEMEGKAFGLLEACKVVREKFSEFEPSMEKAVGCSLASAIRRKYPFAKT